MPETRVHVLVVEDDATLREGLRASFRNQGWRVEAVRDGDEAVAAIEHDRFDCIVLDLMLPKRSGLGELTSARQASSVAGTRLTRTRCSSAMRRSTRAASNWAR